LFALFYHIGMVGSVPFSSKHKFIFSIHLNVFKMSDIVSVASTVSNFIIALVHLFGANTKATNGNNIAVVVRPISGHNAGKKFDIANGSEATVSKAI
jgi:hypothetical protein